MKYDPEPGRSLSRLWHCRHGVSFRGVLMLEGVSVISVRGQEGEAAE
jgi:hypothetical protein